MPRKRRKPTVTRNEPDSRFITVAAQQLAGVRLDIDQPIQGGEELHVEAYDYHGRKVHALVLHDGTDPAFHPEIVFRLVIDPEAK